MAYLSCDVHYSCDGSCLNGVLYPGPPLIEEDLEQSFYSMLSQTVAPRPTRAAPQYVRRNFDWVEQQDLSKFEYSAMNSLAGEIRFLRVEKSLFRSDVIECNIITTFLGQSQELQAL